MKLQHDDGATLEDGLLVRHLHDELDVAARSAVNHHLAACDACARRLAALRSGSRRAGDALRAADFDAPDPARVLEHVRTEATARRNSTRLRIAAGWVLVVLAAGALATAPVRAWIAERWVSLTADPTNVPAMVTQPPTGSASLRFATSGPGLDVAIAGRQAAGTLTVRFTDDDAAEVTVTGSGLDALTVGRRDVRIDNDAESSASWEIALPHHVEHAEVRIGTTEALRIVRGTPVRIALDSGRRVRTGGLRDESS